MVKDSEQSLADGNIHEEYWKIERIIEDGNVRINFYVDDELKLTALDDSEFKHTENMIGMGHFRLGNYNSSF